MGFFSKIGRTLKGAVNTAAKVASFTGLPGISQVGAVVDRLIPDSDGRPMISSSPARPPAFASGGTPGFSGPLSDPIRNVNPDVLDALVSGAGTIFGGPFGAVAGPVLGQLVGAEARSVQAGAMSAANVPAIMPQLIGAGVQQRAVAPRGYRVHRATDRTAPLLGVAPGTPVGVRLGSDAAKVLGVTRSKRPPISVGDAQAIKRADSAKGRVKKLAQSVDFHVYNEARASKRCAPRKR